MTRGLNGGLCVGNVRNFNWTVLWRHCLFARPYDYDDDVFLLFIGIIVPVGGDDCTYMWMNKKTKNLMQTLPYLNIGLLLFIGIHTYWYHL